MVNLHLVRYMSIMFAKYNKMTMNNNTEPYKVLLLFLYACWSQLTTKIAAINIGI
jgi:hypothetical protein